MNVTDRNCYILDTFRCWQKWEITFEIDETQFEVLVIDLGSKYTFQTQYVCTIDFGNSVNKKHVEELCNNFTIGLPGYERSIITMDTQYLDFQVLSTYTDESGYYDQSSVGLEFYYDAEFLNQRIVKQDPFEVNETVYVQIEFSDENVVSFDVKGIYLCFGIYGEEKNAQG